MPIMKAVCAGFIKRSNFFLEDMQTLRIKASFTRLRCNAGEFFRQGNCWIYELKDVRQTGCKDRRPSACVFPGINWNSTMMVRRCIHIGISLSLLMGLSVASAAAKELIADPDLAKGNVGKQWWATPTVSLSNGPGRICARVSGGTENSWEAILGINGLKIKQGTNYRFSFEVQSETGGPLRAFVQKGAEPWTPQVEIIRGLTKGSAEASMDFSGSENLSEAQVVFHLGGSPEPWSMCLNRVSLESGVVAIDAGAEAASSKGSDMIRINQVGYLPDGPKRATVVSGSRSSLGWELLDGSGRIVSSGKTRPLGLDKASGLKVHSLDFTDYTKPGSGYRLEVIGAKSYPFDITSDLYSNLRKDALSYFYPVRSGIEITDEIAGMGYGRPAGHLGKSRNSGDISVPCISNRRARRIYGQNWSCSYRLDVRGGWYDAGDFGKYVVNGGIAVAQLMGTYERALNVTKGRSQLLKDGFLRIPEHGNGLPDILDEAKWELDFLISMMVPDGQPDAGMVHHKIHGERWTVGPVRPHFDKENRVLLRPSTAATLNLAAAAAQGARLFAPHDVEYAKRLLDVAIRAYKAAEANPKLYAPLTDGSHGGGDYADDDVSDEFYWAAAELFLTTGQAEWYDRLRASVYWKGNPFKGEGFSWRDLSGLARLQLASVPSRLPEADLNRIRNSVLAAADNYLATQNGEGFGLMYNPNSGYGWGSNHSVIQNMIVAAVAFDISGREKYLEGVRESMDYILGRNAVGISYVTGHGTKYAHRQYAMMFAQATDPSFPRPPNGSLAGGPNSQPADDVAQAKLKGCARQACYIDHQKSFSTNEIAINWNAALGWISTFLADTASGASTSN